MRKANREIRDPDDLRSVIERCDVCRLALIDGDTPYIVPLNFGYDLTDGKLTLYFHSALEGRKVDILRRNPQVCFEMDCSHQLVTGETACGYSMNYESIIGTGIINIEEDRIKGLDRLMSHYSKEKHFEYDERSLALTLVLRLDVKEFTGKRLTKPL
ncbi:MAG: pyridoxamine 5'-phosphate oxidase family protein [Candidatus Methanoplasma sp.]|jgi:nitroimidazol reductase NimA-like FMN-containing flavoprotein (pyridoxamine 5'-phosphate oxidase superfamily)|nr:pyridoxamine 5'-phosphate oxidase family protein [Candidatus Methanoplasma sp.]